MNNIVIIPARGNSKRLPKKNVLLLKGKPLIAHSIEYAKQNINLVNDIYVTTDDDEIKRIAIGLGVKVIDRPLRPKALLKEALKKYTELNYDSLMTVSLNKNKLGKIVNGNFEPYNYVMGQRSQDLEPLYFENGILYITKAELILKGRILGENNCPFITNHPYSKVDIDTENDFKYAEFILKNHPNE